MTTTGTDGTYPPERAPTPGARTATAALVLAGLLVVLSPVRHSWTSSPRDSFPLSYYPMFSARRRKTARVVHAVGVHADGTRTRLGYQLCGTGGFNQVRRQLVRAVADGRGEHLATEVARTLAAGAGGPGEVVAVEVVTGTYRYAAWFAGDREAERVLVHARAEVPSDRAVAGT